MTSPPLFSRQRTAVLLATFTLLASAYLFVYSGIIESGDSRYLFNAAASLYRFGDFDLDLSAHERLPPFIDPADPYPLQTFDTEPMQPLLAQPLYALAHAIPGLGLVHTTWTFNIFITALTACILILFGLSLGFDLRAAVLTALLFGLCTIAVPYSKTFFREPLTGLTLLLTALMAERARANGYRLASLLLLTAAAAAMLLTRAASVFALPALLILLLPDIGRLRAFARASARRAFIGIALLIALAVGLFAAANSLGIDRYNPFFRLTMQPENLGYILRAYLLSIGGSIWATSPVVLLLIPGVVLLWRRGWRRYSVALPLLLLGFAVGYAQFNTIHWFGGLSWPPRFLAPTVPLLMVGALPVAALAFQRRLWGVRLLIILLAAVGLWVQFSAVSFRWSEYTRALPAEAGGFSDWPGGLYDLRYIRPVVIPQLWGRIPFDFAWVRAGQPIWGWLIGGLIVVGAGWLGWVTLRPERRALLISTALAAALLLIGGLYMGGLYRGDFEYRAVDEPAHLLADRIREQTGRGDIVLLSNPAYVDFFLNYGKFGPDDARLVSLPPHPGDRPSEAQPPLIESDNPDVLVKMQTIPLLYALAEPREHIWLVENFGPVLPWSVRPVEQFLSTHYYPIEQFEPSPEARLIAFSTVDAPDPFGFYAASRPSDLVFDGAVHLEGYELPLGETYTAGGVLPVSLYWITETPLEQDYTVGLYLRAADGAPVAQSDGQPGWGFRPTRTWRPEAPVWDHRALRLPEGLAPGRYQLWVKVYGFDENFSPQDLPVTQGEAIEGVIGVLTADIQIGE